jgi:mannose-6-phosphate isomerase-like protein (cupin superfamily)
MTIIRATHAPSFELPGVRFTGLASPTRGSVGLCTWRISVDAALVSPAPHRLDEDEIFMVTAGAIRVTPDGPEVHAGDAVVVPAGSPIQLVNPTDTAAEAFVAIRAGFSAVMADRTTIDPPLWAR